MASDQDTTLDLERARLDPASIFASPAALVEDERLTREQKVEILRRWQYDASELAVAEEEGMGGGESSILPDIFKALDAVTGGYDVEHTPPTKHGGG